MKYELTVSKEELNCICNALGLYSAVRDGALQIKNLPESKAHLFSVDEDSADMSYDISCVIDHYLSWREAIAAKHVKNFASIRNLDKMLESSFDEPENRRQILISEKKRTFRLKYEVVQSHPGCMDLLKMLYNKEKVLQDEVEADIVDLLVEVEFLEVKEDALQLSLKGLVFYEIACNYAFSKNDKEVFKIVRTLYHYSKSDRDVRVNLKKPNRKDKFEKETKENVERHE